jgi:hypothetical protein
MSRAAAKEIRAYFEDKVKEIGGVILWAGTYAVRDRTLQNIVAESLDLINLFDDYSDEEVRAWEKGTRDMIPELSGYGLPDLTAKLQEKIKSTHAKILQRKERLRNSTQSVEDFSQDLASLVRNLQERDSWDSSAIATLRVIITTSEEQLKSALR